MREFECNAQLLYYYIKQGVYIMTIKTIDELEKEDPIKFKQFIDKIYEAIKADDNGIL